MSTIWRLVLQADALSQQAYVQALEEEAGALASFETTPNGPWLVEAFFDARPELGRLAPMIFAAAKSLGRPVPSIDVEEIPERDWLAENRASFPPLAIQRFFVFGSHVDRAAPAGSWPIALDASIAFGSGEHATTKGCLTAIDRLARRRRFRRVLDLGCGSAILSIGAARAKPCKVLASDIDADSVRLARENVVANGLAARVKAVHSAGFAKLGATRARFDLVLANILARPLTQLATPLSRALAPGGTLVLSGLLADQEAWVKAAYLARRLSFRGRLAIAGWHTLVFRKPA
ncbi:MAG: methyltransferase domain-containing protein [Alphaproteobacteria bacterium]|nr:methyltransferase domain-containing protein [Alphaproteobacteria bacterium]